jgi:hypothetical protein
MSYTTKIKMAELPEAVQVYAEAGFDPQAVRPLMDLLQEQTQYIQDRFWKMADAEFGRIIKEQQAKAPKAVW